jgi:hypothetical protein
VTRLVSLFPVVERHNPLYHKGILQHVLDMVGPGEHIFLSVVSKSFRACYLKVPVYEGTYPSSSDDKAIDVEPRMTVCSAIFRSSSRLRLAVKLGFALDPESWWCQHNAGADADIHVLVELHDKHRMPYTEVVCRGAAESGSVSKMQWLLDEQLCPQPADLACSAVHASTTNMLKRLKQRGWVFTADTCTAAATSTEAAHMLEYLHSEGVPFDAKTMEAAILYQELPLLQWLCERGCDLSTVDPMSDRPVGDLEVLSWLRSKDCPCNYDLLCAVAAFGGCTDTLQWVKDNGLIEWSSDALSQYLNIAAGEERLDTAKVCAHKTRRICI